MKTPQAVMTLALVVLVILLFTSPRHHSPKDDPSDEITAQGVVQDVQQFYCPISDEVGIHLMVKTEYGTSQIHVAPTRFLRSINLSFNKGDQVQVVGSRVMYEGHGAIIARTGVRAGQTVAFRETNGHPLWVN